MKRRMTILALIVLLVMPAVMAGSFSTSLLEVKQNIFLNQSAEMELTIDNNLGYGEEIDIDIGNDPRWTVSSDPTIALTSEYGIYIPNDDQKKVMFTIMPVTKVPVGWHILDITVRGKQSGQMIKELVRIYVRPTSSIPQTYLPAFSITVEAPEKVDPREEISIRIIIENRNQLNISEMAVKVTSDLFTKDLITELPPLRTKVQTFTIKLNDLQAPTITEIEAEARVVQNGNPYTAHSDKVRMEVEGYSTLKRDDLIEREFLKSKEYFTLENDGNIRNSGEVRLQTSFFDRLFTRSTPRAILEEDGGNKYLVWDFKLAPQETAVIAVSKNYRPLVILIVLLVVLVGAYFIFRSPVTISKSATKLAKKDDTFSELKVLLLVRNRTNKTISNVTVIDRIPRIAEVEKDFRVGTLAPTKITRNDKKGTGVYWSIPALDSYEERIITYRIRSKLTIVGGMSLPPAIMKFSLGSREIVVHSKRSDTAL